MTDKCLDGYCPLEKIRSLVDQILIDAFCDRLPDYDKSDDPVNWGDLEIVEIKRAYVVFIEEASPSCKLRKYIESRLEAEGLPAVVVTRW